MYKLSKYSITIQILFILMITSCNTIRKEQTDSIAKAEIRKINGEYRIYLNGAPFFIQGAGVDGGSIEALVDHGANSFRTWSTENGKEVLDKAHRLGLKVMMGIGVGLERHGFDYNDDEAVKIQLQEIEKVVLELKDHPALMLWGIGNEMNLQSKNPKVWDAVNNISKMIHKVDPNHLTTTPLAGIDKQTAKLVASRAPDLDFLSIQLYGPIDKLPKIIDESGYKGPFLITEWGATGYWEVEKTKWGAPIENNSSRKADLYLKRYQGPILSTSDQLMGTFAFLWGQKQERTPTWFGMFMSDGKETESIDVMHYIWNNEWPKNRSPRLIDFTLNGMRADDSIELLSGKSYSSEVIVKDPDDDELVYRWEIMKESTSNKSGGDREYIPEIIDGLFSNSPDGHTTFITPNTSGPYRLFVYIEDGNNHVSHANIPFYITKAH